MKVRSLLLVISAAANLATAQTETKTSPEAEIKDIIAKHQATMSEFMKKARALPREEQRAFYNAEYPKPKATTDALRRLIDASPKTPAVLDALTWIAQNTRGAGITAADYTILKENHLNNPKVSPLLMPLAYSQKEEALDFVRTVGEKSTDQEIRGNALFALASGLKRNKKKAAEHSALVEKIINDHPDLTIRGRKVAAVLKAERDAAIKFAIGKTAPEIIGKDVDGKEMKLSDYKGKVVVLDFWGDW